MKKVLRVLAGPTAMEHIRHKGLHSDDFTVMAGASGGPKWFCLFGLDQFLAAEYFSHRTQPLHLLGSSAGAWRMACMAQQAPAAASKRFCDAYSAITYPAGADTPLITRISARIIDSVFPEEQHLQQVIDNPVMKLNLIVARARKLTASDNKALLAAGLTVTATANLLSRRHLRHFFQRVQFHPANTEAPFHYAGLLPTEHIPLATTNLRQAILASGSIPMVLEPVLDIPGAPAGRYYDGGITDYHFDLPFSDNGLVLYPHFYPYATPGWFDKALKWRKTKAAAFHNVVMLCPSDEWVKSLPYSKIPDRSDFKLPDDVRIQYWRTVIERSFELAEAFQAGQYQIEAL